MRYLRLSILCLLFAACDGGLAPPPAVQLGFSGTVYFSGTWPPADSLINLWIFASQIYPLDSTNVVSGLFGSPQRIFLYPGVNQSLPFNVDSISYSFPLKSGTYTYTGVIQQTSPDIAGQGVKVFRVLGFYKDSINVSQPGIVDVNEIEQVHGIHMNVDFQNLPPQPF